MIKWEGHIPMILKFSSLLIAGTFVYLPLLVNAHHSMSEFDRSVLVEIEGVISRISWKNPHVLLEVTSTGEAGTLLTWNLEGSAVSGQRRHGLTGDEMSVGDMVRVAGSPSTRRDQYLQAHHVLLANGTELLVGRIREPRWSNTVIGAENWMGVPVDEVAEIAAARGNGIFRVWSQGTRAWYFADLLGPANYKVNESAAAIAAEWDDIADNPLIECVAPGMPALMGNPYPMEFVQVGEDIELRFEEFDVVRTIHMGNELPDPANVEASHHGYSVGYWEGETLVVDTFRVSWPYFDRVGVLQTENVAINEQFTAEDDGSRLSYVLTVNEPAALVEPFVWDAYFIWKPGEEVGRYECTLEEWASTENTL